MILLDYSAVMMASLMAHIREENIEDAHEISEGMVRHMVLMIIKKYKMKFGNKYGKMILCMDGKHYWRKDVFPLYKWKRSEDKKNSEFDWNVIYSIVDKIRDEIRLNMPYKSILIDRLEADDIIGVLSKNYHEEGIMIISNDKDFFQLQRYKGVKQYRPHDEKIYTESDPLIYLKEMIIRGDKDDGVPNILSVENSFKDGIRQKSVFAKKVAVWLDQEINEFCDEAMKKRWVLNEEMIDLSMVPFDLQMEIRDIFVEKNVFSRSKMLKYFMQNGLNRLTDNIQDF
jgi:5'-3' exonuclease